MAKTQIQQLVDTIRDSSHPLIVFEKNPDADTVSSALALWLTLKKMGKSATIACDTFIAPKHLHFLLGSEQPIIDKLHNLQQYIVTVNINKDRLEDFSYTFENDKLAIHLHPKSGTLAATDVALQPASYRYDLIITINTPDLAALGNIYQQTPDFFQATTIINIDHQADNEQYGQINYTDINTVAGAELVYKLIQALDQAALDKTVATCLLTGLIAKTHSFKSATVTPATLDIAAQLMNLGADRAAIITSLYRSRSLSTMKLWGRVMARLRQNNGDQKLIWSLLSEHDFVEAQASADDVTSVIDELLAFIPGVEVITIMYQLKGLVHVVVATAKNYDARYIAQYFNPTGSRELANFDLPDTTLVDAEKIVIEKLRAKLG